MSASPTIADLPVRKFEWTTLPRDQYVFPADPRLAKQLRAGFFLRLCSTSLDVAIGVLFGTMLLSISSSKSLFLTQAGIIFYYLAVELVFGQTVGKILFRLELVNIKGPLTMAQIVFRNIIRAVAVMLAPFCPLVFILMCSWRRVTFLDLIGGLRVLRLSIKGQIKKKPLSYYNPDLLKR